MKCTYCNREMIRRRAAFGVAVELAKTNDHVVPFKHGGRKTVPACYGCNSLKGDMYPEVWDWFMAANPNWWLLDKKERRKARRLAIRQTAHLHSNLRDLRCEAVDRILERYGAIREARK